MKIKVLVVPTLIVISGFVALNYIKPEFDTYKQKRVERDAAKEDAAQAENVAKNVNALKGELETQKEKVTFVKRYFPAEKDEARIFDSINFLTGQAGLITSRIQVQKVEDEETAQGSGKATFATNIDPIATAGPGNMPGVADPNTAMALPGMATIAPYQAPAVKKYSFSLEALGGYSNIKDLMKKLEGFDRVQQVESFKISTSENSTSASEGEETTSTTGTLTLTYNAVLPFQEMPSTVTGEGIVGIPGFKQGTFNFTSVDKIQTAITDTVPDTVLGTEGKANPFE